MKRRKPANEEKVQRLREGIRERASTWSKKKKPTRKQEKDQLRKENNEI